MGISASNLEEAFGIVDSILTKESRFLEITGHHLGIFKTHSEFWCAYNWNLDLERTDVSRSIDATATSHSPFPMKAGEGIQIKSRGDQGSMHVDSRIPQVDWLVVCIYDSKSDATSFRQYMFKMTDLCDLGAIQKEKSKGEYRIPLRLFTTSVRFHRIMPSEGHLDSRITQWSLSSGYTSEVTISLLNSGGIPCPGSAGRMSWRQP